MSGLAEKPGAQNESISKSSPWSNARAGGAVARTPIDLEEPTVTEAPALPRAVGADLDEDSNPAIGQVGFGNPRPKPALKDPHKPSAIPRRAIPEERTDTEQIPVDDLLHKVREIQSTGATARKAGQPWDEVIEAASSAALAKFGTTKDAEARTAAKTEAYSDKSKPAARPQVERPTPAPAPRSIDPAQPRAPISRALSSADTLPPGVKVPTGDLPSFPREARPPGARPAEPKPPIPPKHEAPPRVQPKPTPHPDPAATPAPIARRGIKSDELLANPPVALAEERRDTPPPSGRPAGAHVASGTVAAPGELAGVVRSTGKMPALVEPQGTIAAPGELAGLVSDLSGKGSSGLVKDPLNPEFRDRRASEAATNAPRANTLQLKPRGSAALDDSLPARIHTEPEGMPEAKVRPRMGFVPTDEDLPSAPASPLLAPKADGSAAQVDAEPTAAPDGEIRLQLASGTRRAIALVIDAAVVLAVVAVPMSLGIFGKQVSPSAFLDPDDLSALVMSGALTRPLAALFVLIFVGSAASHAFAGRTIGKLLTGLELIARKTGRRPGPVRSVLRALFQVGGLLCMGAGYAWLIVDRRARAFHDVLTGTAVVVSSTRRERLGEPALGDPEPTR
jgi:uncharacterized RDD family membrane protein YckC